MKKCTSIAPDSVNKRRQQSPCSHLHRAGYKSDAVTGRQTIKKDKSMKESCQESDEIHKHWMEFIKPTLELLRSYIVSSSVNVQNVIKSATCIDDILQMSKGFKHQNEHHDMSNHANILITKL